MDWTLYVITDARLSRGRSHHEVIRAAIEGGATVVQYREKEGTTRQLVEEALGLIQDNPEWALEMVAEIGKEETNEKHS